MWLLYQKTKVSTAVVRNPVTKEKGLKLFLHVPIYEHSYRFELYQVYNVPTYEHNVSYGLKYGDLPEYLAVSTDGEMFTVTNTRELSACSDIGNQWLCPITRAFQRVMTSNSCVMALFKNDPTRKQLCSHTLTSNRGIYSVYLGGRK